jgi:LmbE family N-acetylglucosaminyl deacetylase
MTSADFEKGKRKILAIEAHPDDLTFFYGGSIVKFLQEGSEIRVITVTNGSQSTCNPDLSEEKITQIMMDEHKQALDSLGIKDYIQFEGFINHFMYDSETKLKLREKIIRQIREFKPDTIICFDPSNVFEENPDHKTLAQIVTEASSFAAYPLVNKEHLSEGLKPHFVSRILMAPTNHPNVYVDIEGEPLEKKKIAGKIYKSQLDLMSTELKFRLQNIGFDVTEIFQQLTGSKMESIPMELLWEIVSESDAKTTAIESGEFYKKFPNLAPSKPLNHAESFRLCYLGVLEKIRSYLPKECLTL